MDKALHTTKERRNTNTIFMHLSTDPCIAEPLLFSRLLDGLERCLDDPKSPLRARFAEEDDYMYYYDSTPSKTLARRIAKRVVQEPTYYTLGDRLTSSNRSCLLCVYNHSVYLGVNHVFIDGTGAGKFICTVLDKDPFDISVIPHFRYHPVFTECMIMTKALPMLAHFPKRHFSYDVSWDEHRKPHFHKHYSAKQAKFIRMKRALESRHDGKFGYASSIVSLMSLFLLAHSEKDEVSIGLTTAFQSDEERFNKISIVFLCIHRPSNWHQTDDYVRIVHISRQVKRALEMYGKEQALGIYLLTNYYTNEFYSNRHVDCVVSCGTFRFPLTCKGKPATMERTEMFGTSMPVYLAAYTCNDRFHVEMYSRTFDLAVDDSTPFILNRLMRSLPS